MKKLLFIFSLLIISCGETREEGRKRLGLAPISTVIIHGEEWEISEGSDLHDYISSGTKSYASYQIMHYIDCKLCAHKDSLKLIK